MRGFRIFEVWETRQQYDRFIDERLMPIIWEIAPSDTREPELPVYELHGFAVSPHAAEVRAFYRATGPAGPTTSWRRSRRPPNCSRCATCGFRTAAAWCAAR
jgi:hypothetical protein